MRAYGSTSFINAGCFFFFEEAPILILLYLSLYMCPQVRVLEEAQQVKAACTTSFRPHVQEA